MLFRSVLVAGTGIKELVALNYRCIKFVRTDVNNFQLLCRSRSESFSCVIVSMSTWNVETHGFEEAFNCCGFLRDYPIYFTKSDNSQYCIDLLPNETVIFWAGVLKSMF